MASASSPMPALAARLRQTLTDTQNNPRIEVLHLRFDAPYDDATLTELSADLEVTYAPSLLDFYRVLGGVSFAWKGGLDNVRAEDAEYLGGAVEILNPFDLVMGKGGRRWKGELWFDDMDAGERTDIRAFAPFDIPTPECMAGFGWEAGGKMIEEMRLLKSSDGVLPLHLHLSRYLEGLCHTRGFYYWQDALHDGQGSDAYDRLHRYGAQLFPGFDEAAFQNLLP